MEMFFQKQILDLSPYETSGRQRKWLYLSAVCTKCSKGWVIWSQPSVCSVLKVDKQDLGFTTGDRTCRGERTEQVKAVLQVESQRTTWKGKRWEWELPEVIRALTARQQPISCSRFAFLEVLQRRACMALEHLKPCKSLQLWGVITLQHGLSWIQ